VNFDPIVGIINAVLLGMLLWVPLWLAICAIFSLG
jgi:hypothetical protein